MLKNVPVTALLIHIVIILNAKHEVIASTVPEIKGSAKIPKVGHVSPTWLLLT